MAKRNAFDPSKDVILATIEVVLDAQGNAVTHGAKVAQPVDKTHTRYRFSVAQYNGGAARLRRHTVYTRKDGAERATAASSVLVAHVSTLAKIGESLSSQVLAALKAA
tara:strand:- start:13 stop:336 length:324 start_codon:yes stop_codon:yes gene_type:complete